MFAQYVGAMLLVAGMTAVGTWTSSLTRNQVTAFILGVAVMFVLVLGGLDPLIVGLPPVLGSIAARLGVLSHFMGIARGVIDLRDAVYFVSLAALFLVLAYAVVRARGPPAGSRPARRLQLGTGALVAAAVVVNLAGGSLGGRLDLTPGNAYTLSPATRTLVGGLDDLVTIKLFVSRELPPEISLLGLEVEVSPSGFVSSVASSDAMPPKSLRRIGTGTLTTFGPSICCTVGQTEGSPARIADPWRTAANRWARTDRLSSHYQHLNPSPLPGNSPRWTLAFATPENAPIRMKAATVPQPILKFRITNMSPEPCFSVDFLPCT